jgi:hypothetical protein
MNAMNRELVGAPSTYRPHGRDPAVEERIICDFERIIGDALSGLLAKRGAAFRSF